MGAATARPGDQRLSPGSRDNGQGVAAESEMGEGAYVRYAEGGVRFDFGQPPKGALPRGVCTVVTSGRRARNASNQRLSSSGAASPGWFPAGSGGRGPLQAVEISGCNIRYHHHHAPRGW